MPAVVKDTHHRHAYLKAVSRETSGEFAGTVRIELHDWPDPTEAVGLVTAITAITDSRDLTWWVKPPAKKYQKPVNQDSLF